MELLEYKPDTSELSMTMLASSHHYNLIIIEVGGGGGGMKMFTYIEGGYENFSIIFGRVWKYVLEILFILYPPPPLVELLYDRPCMNFINLN